jgi:hypothetical protein
MGHVIPELALADEGDSPVAEKKIQFNTAHRKLE